MNVRPQCSLAVCSATLAALALAVGCADDSADTELFFEPFNTAQSVDPSRPVRVFDRYVVYQASELESNLAHYNTDTDSNDQVAFVIDMVARTTNNLGTAVRDTQLLGGQVFMVVDEAEDETDWNNDGDGATMSWDDLVLLQCSASNPSKSDTHFVATLAFGFTGPLPPSPPRMLVTNSRLYFTDDPSNMMAADDTTLNYVTAAAPITPIRVKNADAAHTLQPSLMVVDEDLLFLTLNETTEGRNLNGDTDVTPNDAFVLALVDGEITTPVVHEVGLALQNAQTPVRALRRSPSDWVVGFLVDEAAQGGVSRNNAGQLPSNWLPTHCSGGPDVDANDHVLAFLEYTTWLASTSPIVNTGFAGVDRVLVLKNGNAYYIATIVPEADEGNCTNAGGLNDDNDRNDRILRWCKVESILGASGIFRDKDGLIALADTDGGTHGATDLNGRWLAVVDEAADGRSYDGLPAVNNRLLGWLNPAQGNSATWTFDHGTGMGIQAAGTDWLAERKQRDYVLLAFQESVFGAPLNNSDSDVNDSVPTLGRFDPSNADDFDFNVPPAVAVEGDNAGLELQNGTVFFRVDEAADNRDWNGDGVKNDQVLFRMQLSNASNTNYVSPLNGLGAGAVFMSSSNIGAAFIFDESAVGANGTDLNHDGDANDFVLRYMRIGP